MIHRQIDQQARAAVSAAPDRGWREETNLEFISDTREKDKARRADLQQDVSIVVE